MCPMSGINLQEAMLYYNIPLAELLADQDSYINFGWGRSLFSSFNADITSGIFFCCFIQFIVIYKL